MAFAFVPKDSLSKDAVKADYGFAEGSAPKVPDKTDLAPYDGSDAGNRKYLGAYRDYKLGINSVDIRETKPKEVSAFISNEVTIGNCSYIKLKTKTSSGTASVEYSVIDGTTEKPILPVDETMVIRERIFPGLPLRFTVKPDTTIYIYKNGSATTLKYADLTDSLLRSSDVYTASYMPAENDAHIVYPVSTKVRVKAVQRYDSKHLPAVIKDIAIQRYGGNQLWTM